MIPFPRERSNLRGTSNDQFDSGRFELRIPDRLRDLPWVGWNYQPKPGRLKPAKVPINPRTGNAASVSDPRSWGDFGSALAAAASYDLDGVGVVLTPQVGLTGVDLDDCRNPTTGKLDQWADRILDRLPDTYAEWSPSRRGVRSFIEGVLPAGCRNRVGDIEAYSTGRFLTITGAVLPDRPLAVTDAAGGLNWLVAEYLTQRKRTVPVAATAGFTGNDFQLLQRALAHPVTGQRLAALLAGEMLDHWSQSEAEYELCRILGFWCGGDPVRVMSILRTSSAYRPKWDERRGNTTWIGRTIQQALANLGRVYSPGRPPPPKTQDREDKSVSRTDPPPAGRADRLLAHIRGLRMCHGRPVGFSVRQAEKVIGVPRATSARQLAMLVQDGRLILIAKGNNRTRLASVYDLPEFAPAPNVRSDLQIDSVPIGRVGPRAL